MEITKEDLANMTPDQIAALQKQNCIFCHIISGKVSSKKVYEDETCMAILDINPANPGHILLLPKEHYTILPLIPEDVVKHMSQIAKHLSQAVLRVMRGGGTNIFIANGAIAGQKAPHFMIHIIPRKENDDVTAFKLERKQADMGILAGLAEKLLPIVADVLKTKAPVQTPVTARESPAVKEETVIPETPKLEKKLDIDNLAKAILSNPKITAPPSQEGSFIASTQSNRVHATNCPLAKKIKDENLVRFKSVAQATGEGYEECDCLK